MDYVATTPELVEKAFSKIKKKLAVIRKRVARPLTASEKILFGHLSDEEHQELNRGAAILKLNPDRVAMQDATAQMAVLQYMSSGRKRTAVPTTIHCDHLIRAEVGAKNDMKTALDENREVYDFLETASAKLGIGFWRPGAGIIHQVILEKYAFPGGLMIGTDSHTPNAGGLGMLAVGVGGASAVDVMAGLDWEVKHPKIIGVHLTGSLQGWTSPKDIICYLCGVLTVKGGTNAIIEYFGPGAESISATGKGTITNMGAELGATCSFFPYDDNQKRYLLATEREKIASLCDANKELLVCDPEVLATPEKYFDKIIHIDLSSLEPQVVGPGSPDVARSIGKLKSDIESNGWPKNIKAALIGSCTNSSYEDIGRVCSIALFAKNHGLKVKVPLMITPGSNQVFETIKRDGFLDILESVGATVLANACGPCIGQWKRHDIRQGETNSILSSFNRNFPARNDGNPETLSFLASPETVMAISFSGDLTFNFMTDPVINEKNKSVYLQAPEKAPDVPPKGFSLSWQGYLPPPENGDAIEIKVDPKSERLSLLKPFLPWDGKDLVNLPVLVKIKGKCTTDHISPAGKWLKYRGHLDRISQNMFTGAINAFSNKAGETLNQITHQRGAIPDVARFYKEKGMRWAVVGEDNYGEGSSREHAAMSPRYLGGIIVIAKSFARIHETNLKKQGILAATFIDPNDYAKILEEDTVSIVGLASFAPQSRLKMIVTHRDKKQDEIFLTHTFSDEQILWFKKGSALNCLVDA